MRKIKANSELLDNHQKKLDDIAVFRESMLRHNEKMDQKLQR